MTDQRFQMCIDSINRAKESMLQCQRVLTQSSQMLQERAQAMIATSAQMQEESQVMIAAKEFMLEWKRDMEKKEMEQYMLEKRDRERR